MFKQMAGLLKLMKACREGKLEEVKELISQGVNPANNLNGWTPLLMAIRCGQAGVAQFFLMNYPDLKTKDLINFSSNSAGYSFGYSSMGDLARKYCPEILPSLGESREPSQIQNKTEAFSGLGSSLVWFSRRNSNNENSDENNKAI